MRTNDLCLPAMLLVMTAIVCYLLVGPFLAYHGNPIIIEKICVREGETIQIKTDDGNTFSCRWDLCAEIPVNERYKILTFWFPRNNEIATIDIYEPPIPCINCSKCDAE